MGQPQSSDAFDPYCGCNVVRRCDHESCSKSSCAALCSGPTGGEGKVFNKADSASVFCAPAYKCAALATTLEEDGAAVLCAFDDGAVGAWLWRSVHPLESFWSHGHGPGEASCVGIFAPCGLGRSDSVSALVGYDDGRALQYELDDGRGGLIQQSGWQAHAQSPTVDATFSGVAGLALDGCGFATGGSDGDAHIWGRNPDGKIEARRRIHGAHGGAVTAVALAADLLVSGGEDGTTRLWSPVGDVPLPKHGRDTSLQQLGLVRGMVLDAAHNRLCTCAEDGFVRLWDVGAGRATWRVFHPTHQKGSIGAEGFGNDPAGKERVGAQAIAVDSGGILTQLASGGSDGSVRIWDVREPKPVVHMAAHSRSVVALSVHGDRMLSASLDGSAVLWDIRSSLMPLETVDLLGPRPVSIQTAPASRSRGRRLSAVEEVQVSNPNPLGVVHAL